MANRYWSKATAGNWADANSWATTDGGDPTGIAAPTASDDVFFTGTNVNNCAIAATATAKSVTFTAYTGTISGGSGLTISGNLTLTASPTWTHTGTITFNATATITSNTKAITSGITINAAGATVQLADDLNTSRDFTLTAGTFDTTNKNITCSSFSVSGSGVRTLTSGTSTIDCLSFSSATTTNFTQDFSANTINVTNGTFGGGSLTYGDVTLTAKTDRFNNTNDISGTNTFSNFTVNASNSINSGYSISASQTVSGTFSLIGYSRSKIITLRGSTAGVQQTITAAALSLKNCALKDIIGAGAGTWAGKGVHDYGNNTGITFSEFNFNG